MEREEPGGATVLQLTDEQLAVPLIITIVGFLVQVAVVIVSII